MSTYSSNLKIELIGTGEQVGTWGGTTNSNFSNVFETAIVGRVTVNFATDANKTLSASDSVGAQDFRNVYLNLTSSGSLTATRDLIVPTINKNYIVQNNTTGGQSIRVITAAGTGITVPNGATSTVYVDGTNVIAAFSHLGGNLTIANNLSVGGTLTLTGGLTLNGNVIVGDNASDTLTINSTITSNMIFTDNTYDIGAVGATRPRTGYFGTSVVTPALTVSGLTSGRVPYATTGGSITDSANLTFNGTTLTANTLNLSNALGSNYGGTGQTTYTAGDILYYSTGTSLTKLGIGTSGQVLTSTGTAPQWSTLSGIAVTTISFGTTGLTPATATGGAVTVAGTLVVSNGGTGLTSLTAGYIPFGAGTAALGNTANLFWDNTNLGLGLGSTSVTGIGLRISTNATGATSAYGVYVDKAIQSSVTTAYRGYHSEPSTAAASFTLGSLIHYGAYQGTIGAGSTVTNQYGFFADSTLVGATNDYGFYSNIASGTGRWNFYANGTAANYFGGATTIETSSTGAALRITQTGSGNALLVEDSANPDATPFVIDASGNVSVGGTFSANGGATLGDASGDALTINSSAVSIPNGLNFDSNTFVIDATNNYVGVNKAPSIEFDVAGRIRSTVSGGTPIFYLNNGTTQNSITNTSGDFTFATDASERMRITSTGNVGIGTSSPANRLDVQVSSNVRIARFKNTSTTVQDYNLFAANDSDVIIGLGVYGSAAGAAGMNSANSVFLATPAADMNIITSNASGVIKFGTNNTERMRITSTGNVGIGTSSPASRLHVAGQIEVTTDTTTPTSGSAYFYKSNVGATVSGFNAVIETGSAGSRTERMRLDSSGNLGLGVTPSAWGVYRAFDIGSSALVAAGVQPELVSNGVFNGTSWLYKATGFSSRYVQNLSATGAHAWFNAASGTAGNAISFTQAMTLNSSGQLLVGTTTTTNNLRLGEKLAIVTAGTSAYGGMAITNYGNANADVQGVFDFNRSRGTVDGSMTIVASGDALGVMIWRGSDGTNFIDAAAIKAEVDGTPGSSDMPGRLVFSTTADGASSTTERMRIDSSGNLGLGVTPSAWASGRPAIEASGFSLQSYNSNYFALGQNEYLNSSLQYIYKTSAAASLYTQISGVHAWYTAGSGTAGNAISFTQAMTLDASGNLGIGTTNPAIVANARLVLKTETATTSQLGIDNQSYATGQVIGIDFTVAGGSKQAFTRAIIENGTTAATALTFGTATGGNNATERMRIDSSGNLLVGTTSANPFFGTSQGSQLGSDYVGASRSGNPCLYLNRYTSTGTTASFRYAGTEVGSISVTGSATAYNTSSDYRLKENISPMTNALAKVSQLKPCTYTWKSTGEQGEGFIAHELQEIVPDCVTGEKDAVDAEGNPVYQGIDTSFLVATLTAALQEAHGLIKDLQARVEALEAK